MKGLVELTIQAIVEKAPQRSLKSLPRSLRQVINLEYLKRLPDETDHLYDEVAPHYCLMCWDVKLVTPTLLRAYDQNGPCGDCETIPPVYQYYDGHVEAGLVYDPKRIQKNQTLLTLCHVKIRTHPDGDSMKIEVETFLSQQRLRQLQALILPLVRPHTGLTSPRIGDDELDKYIYELDSPIREGYVRKINYWAEYKWGKSFFERIVDQRRQSLKDLPRSLRKGVNLVHFNRNLSRLEKLQYRIFHVGHTGPPGERLVEGGRPTLLLCKDNYFSYNSLSRVSVIRREDSLEFKEGLAYDWEEVKREQTVINLYEISGKIECGTEKHQSRIETSPSQRRFRRLQALLLPLVRPYIRLVDLPMDVDYSEYIEIDPPADGRVVSTQYWREFFKTPIKWDSEWSSNLTDW